MLFIFGIVATELIGRNPVFETDENVQLMFGTVAESMWTLFTIMTLDDWSAQARHSARFDFSYLVYQAYRV